MRALAIVLILVFSSCVTTKEQRRMNRATRKLENLVDKFPELNEKDTIFAKVKYTKPKTTMQIRYVDKGTSDTIVWKHNDATLIRWSTPDTTYYTVICDTVTITQTEEIPIDRIQPVKYIPVELAWWQKALIFMGILSLGYIVFSLFRSVLDQHLNRF